MARLACNTNVKSLRHFLRNVLWGQVHGAVPNLHSVSLNFLFEFGETEQKNINAGALVPHWPVDLPWACSETLWSNGCHGRTYQESLIKIEIAGKIPKWFLFQRNSLHHIWITRVFCLTRLLGLPRFPVLEPGTQLDPGIWQSYRLAPLRTYDEQPGPVRFSLSQDPPHQPLQPPPPHPPILFHQGPPIILKPLQELPLLPPPAHPPPQGQERPGTLGHIWTWGTNFPTSLLENDQRKTIHYLP